MICVEKRDGSVPPHAIALREGRGSEHLACYAITKCVEDRKPVLTTPENASVICSSLDYMRHAGHIRVLAFCIMPDHYHLLMFLVSDKSLPDIMKSIGKYTARRINQMLVQPGPLWQEGFHDHRCRDEDDIEDRMTYIEHNPVRKGFVERAEEWPYSSAHPFREHLLDRGWYAEMR